MAFRADSHKLVGQLNVDGSQFIAPCPV